MLDTDTVTSWKSAYLLSFFPDSPVESYFSSSVPAVRDSSTASSTLEALTDREGHFTDPSSPSTSFQSDEKTLIGGNQEGGGAAPGGANDDDKRLEPPRKRLRLDLRSIRCDQHWLQTAAPSADLPPRPSPLPHPPIQHTQTSHTSTSPDSQPPPTTSVPFPDDWWKPGPLPNPPASALEPISANALQPSLRNLTIAHFRRFLLDQPIESSRCSALVLSFIRFLGTALPFEKWTLRAEYLRSRVKTPVPRLVREAGQYQPNLEAIRRSFRLKKSHAALPAAPKLQKKLEAIKDVIRWVWDAENVDAQELADLILRAPTALLVLVNSRRPGRDFAYFRPRSAAEQELLAHLRSLPPSSLSYAAQATLTLLTWFNARPRSHDKRVARFFRHEDGSLRAGKSGTADPWDWVFEAARTGQPVTHEMLDEWEDATVDETRGCIR